MSKGIEYWDISESPSKLVEKKETGSISNVRDGREGDSSWRQQFRHNLHFQVNTNVERAEIKLPQTDQFIIIICLRLCMDKSKREPMGWVEHREDVDSRRPPEREAEGAGGRRGGARRVGDRETWRGAGLVVGSLEVFSWGGDCCLG